jgi:enoyl-CoA hydratase/carnithine racemase
VSAPGTLGVERHGSLAVVRLDRDHGNAINPSLAADLHRVFGELEDDAAVRGVLLASNHPKLFCPGLDLRELIALDRPAMAAFMGDFADAVLRLYAFRGPLVAALSGPAVAGGCVLALTADHRVLRRGAVVGMGEVRLGVGLPYGVSLMLADAVPRSRLEEVALLGRNYADEEAVEVGLVHEIRDADGFEDHCLARLEEFAGKEPAAFALIKRHLRSATVDRIRERDHLLRDQWLDTWFADGTRARLESMVRQLQGGEERR